MRMNALEKKLFPWFIVATLVATHLTLTMGDDSERPERHTEQTEARLEPPPSLFAVPR